MLLFSSVVQKSLAEVTATHFDLETKVEREIKSKAKGVTKAKAKAEVKAETEAFSH